MSAREYWKELNEMYGTDLEFPEAIETENFKMSDVIYDMGFGGSFDGAMQKDMEV